VLAFSWQCQADLAKCRGYSSDTAQYKIFWSSAIIFWQQLKSYGLNLANLTFFSLKYGDFVPFLLTKFLGKTGGPASNQTKIQNFLKIIFIIKHIRKTRIFLKKK
jgi:hypothetical protein